MLYSHRMPNKIIILHDKIFKIQNILEKKFPSALLKIKDTDFYVSLNKNKS